MTSVHSATIPPQLTARLARNLGSGEEIVWIGQPQAKRLLLPTVLLSGFGLFMAAMGVVMYLQTAQPADLEALEGTGMGWMVSALCGVFVITGLGIAVGVPLFLRRKLNRTLYAVTTARALILEGRLRSEELRTFVPAALAGYTRRERSDGSGDLIFGRELQRDAEGHSSQVPVGFLYIENVRQVEALVQELAAKPTR